MTQQEVYDKVKVHLLKQNKRSFMNYEQLAECAYRGNDGLKCAIGCLIPDEVYSPAFEGWNIEQLLNNEHVAALFDGIPMEFLRGLQMIHDFNVPASWGSVLYDFARNNGLNP